MSRIEIFRGQARRRWSDEAKRRLVELSSNVVDGRASGGVLEVGFTVDEAHAPDHLTEAGRAVEAAPTALGAQAEAEDHGQRRAA